MKIDIVRLPHADFYAGVTGGCVPVNISFSGTDTAYQDSVFYEFGDGATSGDVSPSHEYTAAGLYDVALTAHSNLALADDKLTRYEYLEVLNPPIADFISDYTAGSPPFQISFSSGCTGDVSNYLWDFGDGATAGTQNPAHTYSAQGTYDVALTAGNQYCSDDIIKSDYIVMQPSGQWVSRQAQSNWLDGEYWDKGAWESPGNCSSDHPFRGCPISLYSNGTWVAGLRPTKIRVTGTTILGVIIQSDSYLRMAYIRGGLGITVLEENISLTADLYRLWIETSYYPDFGRITNIEFYEEG